METYCHLCGFSSILSRTPSIADKPCMFEELVTLSAVSRLLLLVQVRLEFHHLPRQPLPSILILDIRHDGKCSLLL